MASNRPLPVLARLVIGLFVPKGLRDEVEGDLAERFEEVRQSDGRYAARRWLRWQLLTLRPLALRRQSGHGDPAGGDLVGRGHDGRGWAADIRQGLRSLRLRPGSSMVVVLTVGLAVGATTSVYSVVDGVLLRPLPYPDAERLVRVWQTKGSWMESQNSQLRSFANRFPISMPTFGDWTRADLGFEELGAFSGASYVHQGESGAEVLQGGAVTSGVFGALRVEPLLGRHLLPSDDPPGAPRVVVLGESTWAERFERRTDVLGSTLSLDGLPHVIVGVMPSTFQDPAGGTELWAPFPDEEKQDVRDSQYLSVVGRLADGVTLEMAAERLARVQADLAVTYPDEHGDIGSRLEGLLESVVGDVSRTLWFLLGAVALVLVVATLNIANVLAVLGLGRRREMAVKAALGAGAGRLMRGLFIESAVLSTIGGLAGIGLAWLSLPLVLRMVPVSIPRYEMIAIRPEVLVFGLAVTALTTTLVGTLPALQASATEPREMMLSSTRGSTTGRRGGRLRAAMVGAEIALAFVLLVAAGLLGNSFLRLWSVERGFATEGLVVVRTSPYPQEYSGRDGQERFVAELRARFDAIPGVQASAANQIPLSGSMSTTTYRAEQTDGEGVDTNVVISVGLENYMALMGIRVIAGRGFQRSDTRGSSPVAIVNEALAAAVWPDESPIGRRLRGGEDLPWVEVVGVARNVQHQGLRTAAEPKLYVPAAQSERSTNTWILRVQGDLDAAIERAREAVAIQSPTTPVRDVQILEQTISESVAVPRFRTFLVVGLAGLAALLALIGVYGVVTFAVTQRTREIGVRMALGADVYVVVRDVVASGLKLTLGGVVVGVLIAWPAAGVLRDFLFDVTPTDPSTYALIAVGVTVVSGVAAYLPARGAATVDPVSVLNGD